MATGLTEEDDVPDLEDLSELLGQVKTLGYINEEKKAGTCNQTVHHGNQEHVPKGNDEIDKKPTADGGRQTTCKKSGTSSVQTFGGFQKGFLNKKSHNIQSKSPLQKNKDVMKDDEIPIICPNTSVANDLRLPEVQEAMKSPSSLLQNTDWLTDDFLKKLQDRPDLLKKLSDPKYSQALSKFSSNPQQGWQQLSGNQEMQEFIKQLCSVLGDHFATMTDQQNEGKPARVDGKTTSTEADEDQIKMTNILSDPETLNVLKDPWISKLVRNLKENPAEAKRMLARSKPEVLPKIKKLVDAGILSFG